MQSVYKLCKVSTNYAKCLQTTQSAYKLCKVSTNYAKCPQTICMRVYVTCTSRIRIRGYVRIRTYLGIVPLPPPPPPVRRGASAPHRPPKYPQGPASRRSSAACEVNNATNTAVCQCPPGHFGPFCELQYTHTARTRNMRLPLAPPAPQDWTADAFCAGAVPYLGLYRSQCAVLRAYVAPAGAAAVCLAVAGPLP